MRGRKGNALYRLAQVGDLDRIVKCGDQGWTHANGWCFPFPAADNKTYGWKIP